MRETTKRKHGRIRRGREKERNKTVQSRAYSTAGGEGTDELGEVGREGGRGQ